MSTTTDYDFIIVGARCAGAATARYLASRGARVLCVDRAAFGSDTLSTSYLMRGAVMQLQRWGVLPKLIQAGTPAVGSTHFHYDRHTLEVPHPGEPLYAPRRTLLDPLLACAARDAGAELRFGTRVHALLRDSSGRVSGVQLSEAHSRSLPVTAHTVIGADGLASSVAGWVDAPSYRRGRYSEPFIYGHFEGLSEPAFAAAYHWYYVRGMAAGVAPTNAGAHTVFVGAPELPELGGDRHASMLQLAHTISPALGESLMAARRVGALRRFPGMRGFYRQPYGQGWALVGDAGYFRDPNTAHGISDALRDAELLARALCQGTEQALVEYHATRDAATERLFEASDEIAGGQWDDTRIEQLLRSASEGIRDGVRVIRAWDRERPATVSAFA